MKVLLLATVAVLAISYSQDTATAKAVEGIGRICNDSQCSLPHPTLVQTTRGHKRHYRHWHRSHRKTVAVVPKKQQARAPQPELPKALVAFQAPAAICAPMIEFGKSVIGYVARQFYVFPATAVQRGQFAERRPRHRHAGIDLAGEYGSPILASRSGRVLPPPGKDRGYGPHVLVIKGEDNIVYRYAHLSSVTVKIGDTVKTGQRIGSMGRLNGGMPHLHFEMIPVAEYRRRPYGLHSLDPNSYLGGSRGARMTAGLVMAGAGVVASTSEAAPVKKRGRYAAAH